VTTLSVSRQVSVNTFFSKRVNAHCLYCMVGSCILHTDLCNLADECVFWGRIDLFLPMGVVYQNCKNFRIRLAFQLKCSSIYFGTEAMVYAS
jgi:hypothetical protein